MPFSSLLIVNKIHIISIQFIPYFCCNEDVAFNECIQCTHLYDVLTEVSIRMKTFIISNKCIHLLDNAVRLF